MDCDPTRTDDMYSLLLSKSEFLTSTVSRSCGDDGTFENDTVHDGALLAELEQTIDLCGPGFSPPCQVSRCREPMQEVGPDEDEHSQMYTLSPRGGRTGSRVIIEFQFVEITQWQFSPWVNVTVAPLAIINPVAIINVISAYRE